MREGQGPERRHRLPSGTANGNIGDIITMRSRHMGVTGAGYRPFEVKRVGGAYRTPAAALKGERADAGEDVALNDITPIWHTDLKPAELHRLGDAADIRFRLRLCTEYTGPESVGTRPAYFYNTWLQQKIAGPIMLAIMPLLGAIAAFALHHRQGAAVPDHHLRRHPGVHCSS